MQVEDVIKWVAEELQAKPIKIRSFLEDLGIRWERQRLKAGGYLKGDSPYGIWEITDKGRKPYEDLEESGFHG